MDKIYVVLSPSQQYDNSCKMGDNEAEHCRKICNLLFDMLQKDDRFVPYIIPVIKGEVNYVLNTICDFSNSFIKQNKGMSNGNNFYHISVHTDAYNGIASGASAFFYKNGTPGEKMAKSIYKEISTFTPWIDRGCYARQELCELRKTVANAVLCELSFHDEITQAKLIHEAAEGFATAILKGIYKGCDLIMPKENKYDPNLSVDDIVKRSSLNQEAWINFKETIKNLAEARGDTGDLEIGKYIDLFIKKIYDCDR